MSGGLKLTLIGLTALVSLFFSGCGGGESGDNGGGGIENGNGGNGNGGGGCDASLDQLSSKFPVFNVSGLSAYEIASVKWYSQPSKSAMVSFQNSLYSKSFESVYTYSFGSHHCPLSYFVDDLYKENAKGDLLACAGFDEDVKESNVGLISLDGSKTPNDADINDVFGDINGRSIVAIKRFKYRAHSNQEAQAKFDEYVSLLEGDNFERKTYSGGIGYEKRIGDHTILAQPSVSGDG
ncbi:MAG: hypothetical protein LBQ52_02370, partial [Helicobacteraceae bacterium]|nr:hypothetical protein [Helicobacteraceae bacterium]